jgi:hypothetical protein
MLDKFKSYLQERISLTDEQFELISKDLKVKTFKRTKLCSVRENSAFGRILFWMV